MAIGLAVQDERIVWNGDVIAVVRTHTITVPAADGPQVAGNSGRIWSGLTFDAAPWHAAAVYIRSTMNQGRSHLVGLHATGAGDPGIDASLYDYRYSGGADPSDRDFKYWFGWNIYDLFNDVAYGPDSQQGIRPGWIAVYLQTNDAVPTSGSVIYEITLEKFRINRRRRLSTHRLRRAG